MQAFFRIAYSLAVAILFILFVAFGTRTLFTEPERAFDSFLSTSQSEEAREDYFRNVFLTAGALGIAAIAAGVVLFRRVDAMPLGLVLGGIGALLYGWVEWSRGPDEAGTAVIFAMATVGLVVALGAGYWFLGGPQDTGPTETPKKPDNG